ncbi:MAG: hypothetical protein ACI9LI_000857 [Saprospiraceae bacterium]|jgi:hypothetical protein
MKITLDIERYKELLEKEKCLSQQSNSLVFEDRDEFIELLSYAASVQDQISYERREEYYSLISRYIEKVVISSVFECEFLEMEKEDGKAATMITNDFKQLAVFSVDLRALKFSSLTTKIYDVCMLALEFGEEGISDQKSHKSVEKTYFEMRKFLKK